MSQHAHTNEHEHTHTHTGTCTERTELLHIRPSYAHNNIEGPAQLQSSRKEHQSAEDEAQSTNMEWQTPSLFSSNVWN